MKNFTKYKVAFVAFVAQSIQNPLLTLIKTVRKSNLGTGTGQPFGITEQLETKAKKGNTTAHT
jgi:hypothetical protein